MYTVISMEKHTFRDYHILKIFESYDARNLPLDLCISNHFRANKALGSKDRGYIAETIYTIVRWQSLIDYFCEPPITWEKRFKVFLKTNLEIQKSNPDIPLPIRLSFPETLMNLLVSSYGLEKAEELCLICNTTAPATVRVNPLKISREALLERWSQIYDVEACKHSPYGITFLKKISLFSLDEFKLGYFEMQDEGSQLLAALIQAKPGQHVMDYCAGAGGKTLAFAPLMHNKGQIYLHDVRFNALEEAKKRLARAGIQNAQIICSEDEAKQKKLKKKMDWVLVDAPCSGTGTLRRNPDMKWSFTAETIPRLVGLQRLIFEKALSFMRPDGKIVYATCSLLQEENEFQVAHFTKTYGLKLAQEPFKTLPVIRGMDGFYAAVLEYQ